MSRAALGDEQRKQTQRAAMCMYVAGDWTKQRGETCTLQKVCKWKERLKDAR
jgi:hypothetical protein